MATVTHIGIHVYAIWWKIASKVPHIINKISGVMSVIMNCQPRGMFCHRSGRKCSICDSNNIDSPQHVLFECPRLQTTRLLYLGRLIQTMPASLAASFEEADLKTKTRILLSAYGSNYPIEEWIDLYCETACFIYQMYTCRKEAHRELFETTENDLL